MRLPRRRLATLALGLLAGGLLAGGLLAGGLVAGGLVTGRAAAQGMGDAAIDAAIRGMLDTDDVDRVSALVAPLAVAREPGAVAPLIQMLYWLDPDLHPPIAEALAHITGTELGPDWPAWMEWQQVHPEFRAYAGMAGLMTDLFTGLDARFARLLRPDRPATIRWEELVWSSVTVDGVPALDHPVVEPAIAADWLAPDDPVVAARIGGQARAWPCRILDWHEIVNDSLGGEPVTLAACVLSGTAALYSARGLPGEPDRSFGTSGLLWRSNKLMYDRATDSLWSQFTGRPVMGLLAGGRDRMAELPLVTTSWGAWRRANPDTTVLSRMTGHRRDYDRPAHAGYADDQTMLFPVAPPPAVLRPKDKVFGVILDGAAAAWPMRLFSNGRAIAQPLGSRRLLLIGDASRNEVRAFDIGAQAFALGPDRALVSAEGAWRIDEEGLHGPGERFLPRVPGRVAYWFAWQANFPGTLQA